MMNGVEYLHGQGICHRDLKPENLLCSSTTDANYSPFRVIIADFGLSKIFNNGEQLETSCGTPDYVGKYEIDDMSLILWLAPEVITAEKSYDKSVDMWSCGVIAYVLYVSSKWKKSNFVTDYVDFLLSLAALNTDCLTRL